MANMTIALLLLLLMTKRSLAVCEDGLGMDANNMKIPDSRITASSEKQYFYARYGRLNEIFSSQNRNFGAWCAYECSTGQVHYLQVDLGKATTVTAVETQAAYRRNVWVQSYTLSYSYDKVEWHDYKVDGKGKTFPGNIDRYDGVKNNVNPPLTARYIRIMPRTFTGTCPCMRAELYGCEPTKDCRSAIGIDANIRKIPDKSMTASSEFNRHFAYEGRLNNVHKISSTGERSWGAWCPKKTDKSPYLQIDLGRVRVVSGVATQGYNYNLWTTLYHLNYSIDGVVWKQYMEQNAVKLFNGNSDNKTIRTHMLDVNEETVARFIRFIPVKWNNYPNDMACMRVEVYQCDPIKGSVPIIKKGITNKIVKRGTTFNLTCILTGQPGMEVNWLRNGNPFSTTDVVSISNSDKDGNYVRSLVFRKINMEENGNTYSCAANYPDVSVRAVSTAQITVDGSVPTLKIFQVHVYAVEIILGVTGSVVSDIVAFEVMLTDFTTSKKTIVRYGFNSTIGVQKIKSLKPFTKYHINVRFVYLDQTKGSRIPSQQFWTRQCAPEHPPRDLSVRKMTMKVLEIEWKKPENDPCTVPITEYDVTVVIHDQERNTYSTMLNATKDANFTIVNIRPKWKYNVTVRGRTAAGPGPFSTPYIITYSPAEVKTKPPTTTEAITTQATTTITPTTSVPSSTSTPVIQISEELVKIKDAGVNNENVLNVTEKVEKLTNNSKLLSTKDISVTADILEKVVHINGTNKEVGEALVKTVSNVLNANSTVLEESYKKNNTGMRYVKILEGWLEKVDVTESDLTQTTDNIVVKKIKIVKNKMKKNIVFEEKGEASVVIPVEAMNEGNSTKDNNETIYFVYYKRNSFFKRTTKVSVTCVDGYTMEERKVYTPVLASSFVGKEVKNLSKPVTLRFKAKEPVREQIEKTACVYWDFNAKGGYGDWSTKGCRLHEVVNNTIVCHCDHMTNFAAMMDVYAQTSKACGSHGRALSFISVVGCFLSLIGLFLTMVTYVIFRRLRREIAARIMLQLCFALFVVVVLFLTGLERTKEPTTCLAIGISLHYFTLVAFMWMFMEAAFMYHAFVVVWPPREDNDVLKCSFAAWGVPGIIVAATAAADLGYYQGKHYCRVNGLPFYFGFLAPICLVLISNLVIFGIIMYKLSTRPTRSMDQKDISEKMQRLKRAFGIMILMGLTWIFGAIAVEDFRLVFQYTFAICNSLQGFAIFVFYCLSQKNVRDAWLAFLRCDTRSDLKMRTDSYYERRRLSSSASQKSSTILPRTRTNSSTVMMRHDSAKNRLLEVQAMVDDQAKMQTILEMDVEDRFIDNLTSNIYVENPERAEASADPHISVSSAEDEQTHSGSQVVLQPYRSYRALSEIKELNDLLTLADKRKSTSKSNEILLRKSLVVAGSSPLLQAKDKMRAVRSCENVNRDRGSIELTDFATMRARQPRVLVQAAATRKKQSNGEIPLINLISSGSDCSKSHEKLNSEDALPDTPHGSTYKMPQDSPIDTLESGSHTVVPNESSACNTLESNKISLKSDGSTLKGDCYVGNACTVGYSNAVPGDCPHASDLSSFPVTKSHEDIVQWLHINNEDDAQSYTSDEYRSSMCSSLNDLQSHSLPSCRSSLSSGASSTANSKQNMRNSFLGRLIVGPLRGTSQKNENQVDENAQSRETIEDIGTTTATSHLLDENTHPNVVHQALDSNFKNKSTDCLENNGEAGTDEGYSASEEEGGISDQEMLYNRNRKRTKSKNGSVGQQNGFIRSAYV